MKIEYLKLEDITPYEHNPRLNDDAVEMVERSIAEFGFNVPILLGIEMREIKAEDWKRFGFDERQIIKYAAPEMCKCPKCGKEFVKV